MNFPYGKTHLWRLLKKMGFGYEKRGRQRIISERPEIIAWRERYLRRFRKIREAGPERAIVYMDETWLNQGVSGQNLPGQNPPDKIPLDKIPPRTKSLQDKIPLGKIPPVYFIFY